MGETDLFTVAVSLSFYNHHNFLTPVYHRSTLVVTVFLITKSRISSTKSAFLARTTLLPLSLSLSGELTKRRKKKTNNKNILTLLEIAFRMDQPEGSTMQQADIDALIFEARQVCPEYILIQRLVLMHLEPSY